MRIGQWAYVWGTLALILLALLYSWRGGQSLLFLVILLGLIIIQGMVAQLCGPTSAKVERVCNPLIPEAGTETAVTLTITLNGGIPPLWILVEDHLALSSGSEGAGKLLFMGWRRKYTGTYYIHDAKRGVYRGSSVYLTWGDLFGWFMRTLRIQSDDVMIVHPKPLLLSSSAQTAFHGNSDVENYVRDSIMPESTSTLFGRLRDYEAGDPLRQIHWKGSAKKGTLLTRLSNEATGLSRCLLLDTCPDSYAERGFEAAVSAAAAWLLREESQGEEMLLYHNGLQSAITLSDSRGLHRGLDLLADIRLETDISKQALISTSKLLFHAINFTSLHVITLITGTLSSPLVDTALHLSEIGRKLEIWSICDGLGRPEIAKEVARLRKYGISVVALKHDSEKIQISRKGDDVKHVIA
ncbi:hypothetical protein D3C74_157990 [compost metagenome]